MGENNPGCSCRQSWLNYYLVVLLGRPDLLSTNLLDQQSRRKNNGKISQIVFVLGNLELIFLFVN